jgi:uncharacterized protein (TIGR02466 family)
MQVKSLFPTSIGIDTINKKLCKMLSLQIDKLIKNNEIISNNGLCITTKDDLDKRKEFKNLYNLITLKVNNYANKVLGVKENSLKCTGMWSNIHKKFNKHHYHQHANSYISGVLFLNIPDYKKPGEFVIVDPRSSKTMAYADFENNSEYSNNTYQIVPQTGLLLIFPSWLIHGTHTFIPLNNEKRYSLSFNYNLTKCSEPTMQIR